jgi:hypothetical protein
LPPGWRGRRREVAFSQEHALAQASHPAECPVRTFRSHCERLQPSHPFLDNFLSRPQSPGRRHARESASRNPEPSPPQEFAEAATPPQSTAALETSHACSKFSLRPRGVLRNPQLQCACAETVEDKNWLWKELENREESRRDLLTYSNCLRKFANCWFNSSSPRRSSASSLSSRSARSLGRLGEMEMARASLLNRASAASEMADSNCA